MSLLDLKSIQVSLGAVLPRLVLPRTIKLTVIFGQVRILSVLLCGYKQLKKIVGPINRFS